MMRVFLTVLSAALMALLCIQTVSADSPKKETTEKSTASQPKQPTQAEFQEKEKKERAKRESLRLKVVASITLLVEPLNLTRSQNARINALMGEDQWESALESFKTAREAEIHEHAHTVAKTEIPGMMKKFMPAYMQKKISTQRRKEQRRGPPSRDEIASIQKDAQSKMHPAMQKIVMPGLETLTAARLDELLNDEKVLTRIAADRILKGRILDQNTAKTFEAALNKAGFPETLTTGKDDVLNDRTSEMIKEIDIAKVAESAGL